MVAMTSTKLKRKIKTLDKIRKRNKSKNTKIKTEEKKYRNLIDSPKDKEEIKKQLSCVYSKLDKALKSNSIHKNKVNRKKSRLSKLLNKDVDNSIDTNNEQVAK